jgi:glycosyltransferase involved in cell wall biosynthesis
MASGPAVTVLIPVYNGANYLGHSVASVLGQSLADFELVVVDDGSTDRTPEVLRNYCDPRLRVLSLPRNSGIASARNAGIGAARGRYIAFLDHDDIAAPSRLEKQAGFLEQHPAVGMVGSAVEFIDANGATLRTVPMPRSDLEIRWMNLLECPLRQSSLMIRTKLAREQPYDARFLSLSDWDFIQRLLDRAEAANLPEVLVQYRSHSANISHAHRARAIETGAMLSLRAIKGALPDYAISLDEVQDLRAVVLGTGRAGEKKSLEKTKRNLRLCLDLLAAFKTKFGDRL